MTATAVSSSPRRLRVSAMIAAVLLRASRNPLPILNPAVTTVMNTILLRHDLNLLFAFRNSGSKYHARESRHQWRDFILAVRFFLTEEKPPWPIFLHSHHRCSIKRNALHLLTRNLVSAS